MFYILQQSHILSMLFAIIINISVKERLLVTHRKDKSFRLLTIYQRLEKGQHLQKKTLANEFKVSDKTIQRDMDDLRSYLADSDSTEEARITYDRSKNVYYLIQIEEKYFKSAEILSLSKILLESRAFNKQELKALLSKLIILVPKEEQQGIHDLIIKEYFNYVELQHESLYSILLKRYHK